MVGLPPVPAKVPLDAEARAWEGGFVGEAVGGRGGAYGGSGADLSHTDMDRLSRELQSIDIGGVGRRVNGRRLLAFKDV
jgi:hypothetical protein